jgi:hypothetical protein
MQVIDISGLGWVDVTWGDARGAEAASIAFGRGEAHVRSLRMEAGGEIAPHETGSGQLFGPIQGRGWVREGAHEAAVEVWPGRVPTSGRCAREGSDIGLLALVVQVRDLDVGGEA